MKNLIRVLSISSRILTKYDLCDYCLGRLFSKELCLSSNKLLGKKIRKNISFHSERCYICKNLLSNLDTYLRLMLDLKSKYEFDTFLVGAIIKPSFTDRDDFIRSKYKIRGIDSIKTSITKELSNQFRRKTKKKIDFLDPDITFIINFKTNSCSIRSKSISLHGRYNKLQRGFPQKQEFCLNCHGKGCRLCDLHGISKFDSVEGKISEYLFSKFGGTTAKYTWIGGEDISSLVLGEGRPFFVKIQNPMKRKLIIPKKLNLGFVTINNFKLTSNFPKNLPKFNCLIKLKIKTQNKVDSKKLRNLKLLKDPIVIYDKSGKRLEKHIFNLKYKKTSDYSFNLIIKSEGGLPVKRFVESNEVVPGIGQIIDNPSVCYLFDFYEINFNDNK